MSLSGLLVPNDLNIYCRNLNVQQNISTNVLMCQLIILNGITFNNNPSSILNYYEEYKSDLYYTGIYNEKIINGLLIIRLGKHIQCKIRHIKKQTHMKNKQLIAREIPKRFVPDSDILFLIIVTNHDLMQNGVALVGNDGRITIAPRYSPKNYFSINHYAGLPYDIELSWQVP